MALPRLTKKRPASLPASVARAVPSGRGALSASGRYPPMLLPCRCDAWRGIVGVRAVSRGRSRNVAASRCSSHRTDPPAPGRRFVAGSRRLRPSRLCGQPGLPPSPDGPPPTVGPVRRELSFRGSGASRLAVPEPRRRVPAGLLPRREKRCQGLRGALFRPAEAGLCVAPVRMPRSGLTTAYRLLHLRFAGLLPKKPAKRVFRYCCGHRCRCRWFELSYSVPGC